MGIIVQERQVGLAAWRFREFGRFSFLAARGGQERRGLGTATRRSDQGCRWHS